MNFHRYNYSDLGSGLPEPLTVKCPILIRRGKGRAQALVEILVVTALVASSQYPSDRVLWILTEHGGKMERSRLRAEAAMRYSQLNPILDELVKEGRIRISGEIITIRQRID